MNKKLFKGWLLAAAFIFQLPAVNATIHKVSVGDKFFQPQTFTAVVGDTVEWNVLPANTMAHTTTSTSIPSGATPWDSPMTSAVTTFQYVITEPGTYNYVCTPHASFMMGTFTATPITSLEEVAVKPFSIAPNPSANSVYFKGNFKTLTAQLFDLNGRRLKTIHLRNSTEAMVNLNELSKGMYLILVNADGKIYNEKLVIE